MPPRLGGYACSDCHSSKRRAASPRRQADGLTGWCKCVPDCSAEAGGQASRSSRGAELRPGSGHGATLCAGVVSLVLGPSAADTGPPLALAHSR